MMGEALFWINQALVDARHQLRPVATFLFGWALIYGLLLAPATGWPLGADNLITDEPALLVDLRQELRELTEPELIALTLRTRFMP